MAGGLGRGLDDWEFGPRASTDNYVINGGLLNDPLPVDNSTGTVFRLDHHERRHDQRRLAAAGNSANVVNVNGSTGGSVISSTVRWSPMANTPGTTLTFNVAHNGSAPYDLLMSGPIVDNPSTAPQLHRR